MTLPMEETRFSILLDELAAKQEAAIAPHLLADGTKVWIRKAGRHNALWRYALLGMGGFTGGKAVFAADFVQGKL